MINRAVIFNVYVESFSVFNAENGILIGNIRFLNIHIHGILGINCRSKIVAVSNTAKVASEANILLIKEKAVCRAFNRQGLYRRWATLFKLSINLHIACKRFIKKRVGREWLLPNIFIPIPALEFISFLRRVVRELDNLFSRCGYGVNHLSVCNKINLEVNAGTSGKQSESNYW